MEAHIAARNALLNVLDAAPGERIVVVCDDKQSEVGHAFANGALDLSLWTRLVILDTSAVRKEIPGYLQEIFTSQKPDIFINLLSGSSEETPFRIKVIKMETRRRIRLGHCPGVTLDMLTDGALALKSDEYKKMQIFSNNLILVLSKAKSIHLTTPSGTDLTFSVEGRPFFTDTLLDWKDLKWMNLPVGEVIVAPLESSLEGTLVCDMAIGGVPIPNKPVTVECRGGKAISVDSDEESVKIPIEKALATCPWSSVVGEFAFGVNPAARFVDEFLETEKMFGTCHIAFGNNEDFPEGRNPADNHMDFLMDKPTVEVQYLGGEVRKVMQDGRYLDIPH
ncbi:MAG TPA: hypothetical protein ENN76_00615 [Euryarchaeota archaeon]|nr:hypothetical protein [Euryarchaeota archaeon]